MTAPTPRRRQPKGISTGGEFAHNEHDEASPLDAYLDPSEIGTGMHAALENVYAKPEAAPVPDAIVRGADVVGQPFRDDHTPVGFNGVAAKVLGLTSVYYYDDEGRIVGRIEAQGDRGIPTSLPTTSGSRATRPSRSPSTTDRSSATLRRSRGSLRVRDGLVVRPPLQTAPNTG